MDPFFFVQLFLGRCVKALQKFTEPDDVDQFMCDDIKAEGKQTYRRRILQHFMDGVVLEAYFIVIEDAGA